MIKNITTRLFRAHLADVLDDVTERFDRYVISRQGKPKAILMCVDDYEGWLETLEIMGSRDTLKDIEAAKRELREGKGYTFEGVFKRKLNTSKRKRVR